MRKLVSLLALVVTIAALSTGVAFGAAKGTDRPLKGTVTATTRDNLATLKGEVDGTFLFTHLGKGTFHEDITFNFTGFPAFTFTGTGTYVAANGDKLFATLAGTNTPFELTLVSTITGGTGRFADASGTFTTHEHGVFGSQVGVIQRNSFTGTTEGQISY